MTKNVNKREKHRNLAEKGEMLIYEAGAVIQISQKLPTFKSKAAVRSEESTFNLIYYTINTQY